MKRLLLFWAVVFAAMFSACTEDESSPVGDVYGIVSDLKSGAPVRNAEVIISPGNASTVSGSDGHFEFKSLTPGQYKISVEANGYSSNSRQVTVVAGQRISCDIHLTPEADNDVISINPTSIDFGTNELQIAATVTNESDSETEWFLDLGDTPWLYAYPTTGRIGGGKTHSIVFTANRARMNEDKSSVVNISAFGNTHPLSLKCKQSVQLSSVMVVESLNVDFGEEATEQIIRIRNVSETDVNWTLYKVQSERLSMSSTHGIVAPGGSQIVTIRLDREGLDEVLATTFMISDGTVDQPVNVIAYPTPEDVASTYFELTTDVLDFGEQADTLTLTLLNVGVNSFGWKIAELEHPDVVTCSPSNGTLDGGAYTDITVFLNRSALAEGAFESSFVVTDGVNSQGVIISATHTNTRNKIFYTSTDGNIVEPYDASAFGANIVSNVYENGQGVITFDGELVALWDDAFRECATLASITIPDGVTLIEESAFQNCTSLTSITLPNNLNSIGRYAFDSCSSLTLIDIPDGVTSIKYSAFGHCSSLTSITIPDGVTSIEGCTFAVCSGLTSVDIPDSVTSIGDQAFVLCSELTSIHIPDGVTLIEERAFAWCSSLTSINIPGGITSIESSVFSDCSSLKSIDIPDGVTSIGDGAFMGCRGLTSIDIPDGVTSIGYGAFSDCSSLKSIDIPDGVTSIGNQAFYYCSSLTSIDIPDGVTSIGTRAFGYTSLTSVTIPNSVTSIGRAAFEACDNLEEFKGKFASDDGRYLIVDGVLNSHASLNGATSITIPSNVSIIGERVFWLAGMTSVVIPSSVVSIEDGAFNWATSLNAVYCEISTPPALGSQVFDYNATGRIIYVPTASVDAYKAADGWSDYTDAIVGYEF